jgi:hypothetical protein
VQAALRQLRRLLGFAAIGDVGADAAISQKRAVLGKDGNPAQRDPALPAIGEFVGIDEIAIGLLRLVRPDGDPARLGVDRDAAILVEASTDYFRHGYPGHRFIIRRDIGDAVDLVGFPVMVRGELVQLSEPLLAFAQFAFDLDLCGDVASDAAIALKNAVPVKIRHAAGIDPDNPAVRQFARIDEVPVGLHGLDRGKARPSRLGLDDDAGRVGDPLADIEGHRQSQHRLDIGREIGQHVVCVGFPEPVGSLGEELRQAILLPAALMKRLLQLDFAADVDVGDEPGRAAVEGDPFRRQLDLGEAAIHAAQPAPARHARSQAGRCPGGSQIVERHCQEPLPAVAVPIERSIVDGQEAKRLLVTHPAGDGNELDERRRLAVAGKRNRGHVTGLRHPVKVLAILTGGLGISNHGSSRHQPATDQMQTMMQPGN